MKKRLRLYDGTFGCCVLVFVLLGVGGVLLSTACSSGHIQFFGVVTEEDFNRWVETMRGDGEDDTVSRICVWQRDNMKYEPGLYAWWPGYLDAWNQKTNCAGYAVVAMECLARLGYSDWLYMQIDTPFAAINGRWHVVLVNDKKKIMISNGSYSIYTNYEEIANFYYTDWSTYKIISKDKKEVKVVTK